MAINTISNLIINWGLGAPTSNNKLVVTYPCAFNVLGVAVLVHIGSGDTAAWINNLNANNFTIMTANGAGTRWIAIGY